MQRIVYLNGCFDPIHEGHEFFYWKAKSLGDYLIVGVMPDEYILHSKEYWPTIMDRNRARMIEKFDSVDQAIVLPADEISEIGLILEINPSVFCLGPGQYDKPWNWHLKSILKKNNQAIEFVEIPGLDREKNRSSNLRE